MLDNRPFGIPRSQEVAGDAAVVGGTLRAWHDPSELTAALSGATVRQLAYPCARRRPREQDGRSGAEGL